MGFLSKILALGVVVATLLASATPADADWFATPEMAGARTDATATRLNDGRVLVVGGQNPMGTPLAGVEIFDPATNSWSPGPSLTNARYRHTATLLADGRVIVMGGRNPSASIGTLRLTGEIFDPATDTWSLGANIGAQRYDHTATLLPDGRILVTGGQATPDFPLIGAFCLLYDPATDTWSSAATMATQRARHTATLLANGKVLVSGGANASGPGSSLASLASAELYDPATNSWLAAATMQRARAEHTATRLQDGKVLVVGGFTGIGTPTVEVYDPAANVWTAAAFIGARVRHTATLLGTGEVLVAGGDAATNVPIKQVLLYDPVANLWKVEPGLSPARQRHAATLLANGRVLMAGGDDLASGGGGSVHATAEVYEPRRRLWSQAGMMSAGRNQHAATLLTDGTILVAGGLDNQAGAVLASAERYSPATNSWSAAGSMSVPRMSFGAVRLSNGKVLVAGGDNFSFDDAPVRAADLYDPVLDSWTSPPNMATRRGAPSLTLLQNGKVLVAGGYESASLEGVNSVKSAELYDPVTNAWSAAADMNVDRSFHSAVRLQDGRVLVVGGSNTAGNAFQTAEIYDPVLNSWTSLPNLSTRRAFPSVTLLANGKVLVAGGLVPIANLTLASAEIYDPATNTWAAAAPMRTARSRSIGALLPKGNVLVAGGLERNGEALWSTELYDPVLDAWFPGPSFRRTRVVHTLTPLDGARLLAVGGENRDVGGSHTSAEIVGPADATLAPANADSPDPVTVGSDLAYQLTVSNSGTETATGLTIRDELPDRAVLVSATPSQGRCTGTGPVTCDLGSVAGGASATVDIVVATRIAGTATNVLRVRHDEGGPGFDATATATTTVTADANGCTIVGTPAGETVSGTSGSDVICGLGGNDNLVGLEGDDTLMGGPGDDFFDGGAGTDSVSYQLADRGVTASLLAGSATGKGADLFVAIENLVGSPFADVLVGNDAANALDGRAGDDVLVGWAGRDTLIGGAGTDDFSAGKGDDVVQSRDGIGERVACGAGLDSVAADPEDSVASDCEMASANAATIPLRAWLNGAQVPLAVAGTGLGTVSFDTVTKVLSWNVTYSGLSGACTAAHFHGPASAGVDNSPTVGMTCSASPLTGSAALSPTEEAQLLSGQWYINIHTAANLGGEIRGQVLPVRGDVNGDGQSDVVWRNASTGENYLYPMNGTAILGSEGYLRTQADQNWQIAGIGDFDGDGKADILWRNSSTGENYLYLMNGTSIAGEGFLRTIADQSWQVAGVGDFNGDGMADVLWRDTATGENYLYPMNGTTILGTEGYIRTVADQNWQVAGVGDFNGDGNADILWRNGSTGENYIYPMSGTTIQGSEGFIRTIPDQSWQVVGVGDFDGDGRSDILWRNGTTGENYIYPMAGTTILATEGYIRTVADQGWQVAALGDYNGDGRADIFWRNGSTGENYVYPMGGLTILADEGYVRTVADLAWSPIGAQSPRAIALSGARRAMNQFVAIVNAQSGNLAGSHLLGALDAGLLQDGVDRNTYSGELAETLRGVNINSFTFTRVISYDNASQVLAVVVSIDTSNGVFTTDEREGGFAFKRQADGTWKQYGNPRLAELGVGVEMRTDKSPGNTQGPRQHVKPIGKSIQQRGIARR